MPLTQQRLGTWHEITHELLSRPIPAFPRRLISEELAATFGTQVSWNWLDPDGDSGFDLHTPIPDWPPADVGVEFRDALVHHPLLRWFRASGSSTPTSVGRVPRQLITAKGQHLVKEVLAPIGMEQQISISYRLGPHHHRAFVLAQHHEDFSDEDLDIAKHLQALLMLIDCHHQALQQVAEVPLPWPLTGRELAVLALLADGLTAQAMAHKLRISPRTVQHHLESCYRKLGVCDRLRAVLVARDAGVLPQPHLTGTAAVSPDVPLEATFRTGPTQPTRYRHRRMRSGSRFGGTPAATH